MIDGLPLTFFLPLVVHALAGLTSGITGILTFIAPKRPGRHHQWGERYLVAYSVAVLMAIILSVQHWPADAYLFGLALLGGSFALTGYSARRLREDPTVQRLLGANWVVVHIVGMIGSYVVLWTAFYVDNAHLFPLVNRLPVLVFWVGPTAIAVPFLVRSLSRFAVASKHSMSHPPR
jgi:hypothetical protein